MSTVLYVILALFLLGILITVHEFGHFITARLTGIAVKEFAIGFGPKVISWKGKKHDTVYSLRLLPLGGFNAFIGEDDVTGESREDPRAFNRQAVWKRMLTVLMGPGMNFLLAFAVLFAWLWIGGVGVPVSTQTVITGVDAGTPAAAADIRPGDRILAIGDTQIQGGPENAVTEALSGWKDGDAPLALTLRRGEDTVTASLSPFWDEALGRYRMGAGEALRTAWENCVYVGGTIARALKALVTTGEGFDQTAGPVGTVSIITEQVREGGFDAFLNLLIVISINLGLMNLLPIPGLDGSRFLFLVLEAIRRKQIPQEKEAIVNLVGMALLFGLMIFFTFRDVMNLFR